MSTETQYYHKEMGRLQRGENDSNKKDKRQHGKQSVLADNQIITSFMKEIINIP